MEYLLKKYTFIKKEIFIHHVQKDVQIRKHIIYISCKSRNSTCLINTSLGIDFIKGFATILCVEMYCKVISFCVMMSLTKLYFIFMCLVLL